MSLSMVLDWLWVVYANGNAIMNAILATHSIDMMKHWFHQVEFVKSSFHIMHI